MWCGYCALRRSSRPRPKEALLNEHISLLLLIMSIIQTEKPIASKFFTGAGGYKANTVDWTCR